jgi:peptidoglycan/LPS O-acetylase OafA/YrhL
MRVGQYIVGSLLLSPVLWPLLDEPCARRTRQQKDREDVRAVRVRTDIRQDLTVRL